MLKASSRMATMVLPNHHEFHHHLLKNTSFAGIISSFGVSALQMEITGFSETLVITNVTTWCHNRETNHPNYHHRKNVKSHFHSELYLHL
jgi:hypothetical protein